MKTLTFKGGIHPPYMKDISIGQPLRKLCFPQVAVVPLSQHIGAPNSAIVKKGDYVEEGQIIGESQSFVTSPVHSPIYGKILDVKKAFHPALGPIESVFIERDKDKPSKQYDKKNIDDLSVSDMIQKVKAAGIVGMGGAAFPTHVKLSIPEGKKIETLIINGAECEPYLTCDHTLMTRRAEDILEGIKIVSAIINPAQICIAIEDNKKSAFFNFKKLISRDEFKFSKKIKIVLLKTKYPQGGEKQLIKAISKKEVPPGKLPLDIGFLVQNVGTICAIYEAVCFDKPLIERIVTLSGDCFDKPGNYTVRVGTTIDDMLSVGGISLVKTPKKIIIGGPMMGFSQPVMSAPVLKSTSGILFLSKDFAKSYQETACIKCAKCVDVCPVNLVPTEIMKNVKKEYWDKVEQLFVADCMECGACVYSCPARIPLVQYIKQGKTAVLRKKS
ncbi:MAG: electron transport complex subunit RsxC [Candidatus Omnitrophota bacterium]|nr:electron transport complex subunit RsxC [Candidatus Omnitrophota bacterium]